MKKSILRYGGIMLLFLLVFACTQEQENIKTPNQQVNLMRALNKESDVAYRTDNFKVNDLMTYLHSYINANVTDDFKYYENIPERKNADWFHKNFDYIIEGGDDAIQWVIHNIDSQEILIFGTRVKDTKVVALIFSDGLNLPKEFENKSGILLATNIDDSCMELTDYGHWRNSDESSLCKCFTTWSCHAGWCHECDIEDRLDNNNLLDLIDVDIWIINDYDFEKFGGFPVHNINFGNPVLEIKRK